MLTSSSENTLPERAIPPFSMDGLTLFNVRLDNEPSFLVSLSAPTMTQVNSYHVYPVTQIAALITELQYITLQPSQPTELKYSARYLVNAKGELWFVRAGLPIKGLSVFEDYNAAKDMRILATGYVYFSDDFKFISAIDSQDNGCVLNQERLAYPLAILFVYAKQYLNGITLKDGDFPPARMSADQLGWLGSPSVGDSEHKLMLVKANESLEIRAVEGRAAINVKGFFPGAPESPFSSPTSSPKKMSGLGPS